MLYTLCLMQAECTLNEGAVGKEERKKNVFPLGIISQ